MIMEAQLIQEHELLEYECSDGNQVIITTSEEVIDGTDCVLSNLPLGAQVFEVLHEAGSNFIFQADADANANVANCCSEDGRHNDTETASFQKDVTKKSGTSKSSVHKCNECEVTFLSKEALDLHSTVHVDEAFYACEFCAASRIHWTEMWQHQCSNVDSDPIVCPQCKKTVSNKKQLQIHEEVHELQRRFTSKKMDGYFQRKLQLAETPEVDWGAKPFICGVCGKPFSRLYEVEYHEKLHTGQRLTPNICDKCGLFYLNKQDLNKHVAIGCNVELSRKTDAPYTRRHGKSRTSL